MNSLLCSRNQSEILSFVNAALSCWKYLSEDGYTVVIKGWTWSATILREIVAFKRCSIGSKCAKKISSTPLHHKHQPETVERRQDGTMLSCSLRKILTLPSECRSRNRDSSDYERFSNLLCPIWWACVNCSLRFLFLADRSGTRCGFCCCSHLLQGSMCCVFRDGILHTLVV